MQAPGWPHSLTMLPRSRILHLCSLFTQVFCHSAKAVIGIFLNLSLPPKEILLSFLFIKGNLDIFKLVTSAGTYAMPLPERTALQNFYPPPPFFPPFFVTSLKREIASGSSWLVLYQCRFTVLPSESASPLGWSFTR